jgi:hypothetical protein
MFNPHEDTPSPNVSALHESWDRSWRSLEAPGEDCRELAAEDWGRFNATIEGAETVAEG